MTKLVFHTVTSSENWTREIRVQPLNFSGYVTRGDFSMFFPRFPLISVMLEISKLISFSLDRFDGSTSPGFWQLVGADVDNVQCRAEDWKKKTKWIQWKNSRNSGKGSSLIPALPKIYKGRISSHLEQYEEDRKNFDKQIAKKVQARTKYVDIGMSFHTISPARPTPAGSDP